MRSRADLGPRRERSALGHSQTAETVTATFPHARLSAARMSSQDLHARPVDGAE